MALRISRTLGGLLAWFAAGSSPPLAEDFVTRIGGRLAALDHKRPDPSYQYVFGTACSGNADVSSEVLVHSFAQSGTRGALTRLDACNVRWHYPRIWLRAYTIRTYARQHGEDHQGSMLLNKPWVLSKWLASAPAECRVIVMDLDFVIQDSLDELLFGPTAPHGAEAGTRGKPSGGLYLYGIESFLPRLKTLKLECDQVYAANDCWMTRQVATDSYQAGPPQVMHRDDLRRLVPVWLNETRWQLRHRGASWGMDMPAYSHAAAVYGLRHEVSPGFFVSNAGVTCGAEAWDSIDALLGSRGDPASCRRKAAAPEQVPRPMLHFCQFYSLSKEKVVGRYFGKYEFSERHGGRWAKLSPLSCSTPQPAVLERDDEFLTSVLEDPASPTARRRTAYMIYKLVEAHNEAFAHYHSMCPTRLNASAALASGKAGGGGGKARRPRLHDGHAS